MARNNQNDIDKLEREIMGISKKDAKLINDIETITKIIDDNNVEFEKYLGKAPIEMLTTLTAAKNSIENLNRMRLGTNKKNLSGKAVLNDVIKSSKLSNLFELEKKRMDRYEDYKLVECYIPEISYCIDLIRDSIVSPDDVTKESIHVEYLEKPIDEISSDEAKNFRLMEKKFRIETMFNNAIRDTLMLGDQFIATMKFDDEMNDMLARRVNGQFHNSVMIHEDDKTLLNENFVDLEDDALESLAEEFINIQQYLKKENRSKDKEFQVVDVKKGLRKKVADIVNDRFEFDEMPITGFVADTMVELNDFNKANARMNSSFQPIKMDGAVVKKLDPAKTVKLYSDGVCYGYLYIETQDANSTKSGKKNREVADGVPYQDIMGQATGDFFANNYGSIVKNDTMNKDKLIADVFGKAIERKLDRKFITKNKEFKEYIYHLCKTKEIFNSKIKISYFTPEEVTHLCIDMKEDGYGTSVLSKSLFFALIYIATLITELMIKLSRSKDKRAIYVDVGIDNDIEGAIQEVVSDIKSKEIHMSDLESISSIKDVCSSFDDYFIPVIDGEEPIRFDSIPGQESEVDGEFLKDLLRSIITGMGLPSNLVDATQDVDFARTLIQQNANFIKRIVVLQRELSEQLGELINNLYTCEYKSTLTKLNKSKGKKNNAKMTGFSVNFPSPNYLVMSNLNEQLSTVTTTIDFILDTYIDQNTMGMDENEGKKRALFKREITKDLVTNLDWTKYDDMLKKVEGEMRLEKAKQRLLPDQDGMGGVSDEELQGMMGDGQGQGGDDGLGDLGSDGLDGGF